MNHEIDLSIVLPAFNEGQNIDRAIRESVKFANRYKDYEIIVVDDGSKDETAEKVRHFIAKNPNVRIVQHNINQGYGSAVWDGLKSARGKLIFFTDSDLQFKIKQLDLFIKKMNGGYDVVVGYRKKRAEGLRRVINVFLWQLALRVLIGIKFKDIDCAFKLFRRKTLRGLKISSKGAMFSAELMYRIQQKGLKVAELPVDHYKRRYGTQTGANVKVVARALKELFTFYGKTRREKTI